MQERQVRVIARHATRVIRLARLGIDPALRDELRRCVAPEMRRPVDAPGREEDSGPFWDESRVYGCVAHCDTYCAGDGGEEPEYFAADSVQVGQGFEGVG